MSAIQQILIDHIDIWTNAEAEKKSGRGRSGGNGVNVYGIKKLRELILELAVRGKLVPQDPNDEPASELLKRIQAEKAKLVAEGKIKNGKPLLPITDEEKPFELPNGWTYSRLGDAVEIIRGITFPGSEKTKIPEKGRVACLRTTNVQDQIEWDDLLYIREEFVSRDDQFLMPRDIVMSMANSRELVGKVALVGAEINQKTSFGGFLGVIRPFLIEPRFVVVLLRTPHTREVLIDSASQTTNIANISLAKLRPLFFAIPPLEEQHRIVAKVDELMALCDQLEMQHDNAAEAHEKLVSQLLATFTQSQNADDFSANWQRIAAHFDTLFNTEASIDALKQTLLQLAVMGKLVPQDPNDEPANELLKRMQAEKAKLVAEGKIKKDKPLPPITDEEKPFELPMGWKWVRLGRITSKITDGDHKTPPRILEGFRLFSAKNVRDGYLDFDNCDFISEQDYLKSRERCCPDTGDLLIVSVGGTIGRTSLVPDDSDFALVRSVALIKPLLLSSCYLKQAMDSTLLQESIHVRKRGGAQPCLYLSEIEQFIFPLPPLAEQHRIVAKVDELMVLCDQLKSRITQASQLQKKLSDVVVEQAISS